MTRESWVERHRPDDWQSIQGNTTAVEAIEEWVEDFEPGDPPQLLVGPPGTGKTSTAYVAASEAGLDLNEANASSARKTDDVRALAREARAGDQLVLIDECDSMHTAVNLTPLADELKDPANPIILTANVGYDVPTALQAPATEHEYKLSASSRRAKLKEVAAEEGVPLDDKDLERLAERPDLRSAIHDLQIHAEMGVPVEEDQRHWDTSEFEAMDQMLQNGSTADVDVKPPWLVMWLDENARKDYSGLEAVAAYDALSRADVHLGHVGEGDYRGWHYAAVLAEHVAHVRLQEPYGGFIKWDFPSWVQSSMPDPTDESPEATLYRELSGLGTEYRNGKDRLTDESPWRSMTGSYVEFRESVLPVLDRLDPVAKQNLVMDEGLSQTAAEALDVGKSKYDSLTVREAPKAGEELEKSHGDALSGDW